MPRLKRRGDRDGPAAAGDRRAETDGSANLGAAAGGGRFAVREGPPEASCNNGCGPRRERLPGRHPEVSGLPRTWGLAKGDRRADAGGDRVTRQRPRRRHGKSGVGNQRSGLHAEGWPPPRGGGDGNARPRRGTARWWRGVGKEEDTMSRSGILESLRSEEGSLRTQLVAIQRAIEAIEGNAQPAAGRGRKKATKAVANRKRTMTEEQRTAVAERMRKYWASRREAKAQEEDRSTEP